MTLGDSPTLKFPFDEALGDGDNNEEGKEWVDMIWTNLMPLSFTQIRIDLVLSSKYHFRKDKRPELPG